MAVTMVPEGRLTATGVLLLVLVPLPSWPKTLFPQASTWPVEVSARLWTPPAAMAVTVVPEGRRTATGVLLWVVVPLPSWPELLAPQASTWLVEVSARLWNWPPAMAVTVVPEGRLTATGVLLVVVVPLPSWTLALSPQASTWPLEVSARLW